MKILDADKTYMFPDVEHMKLWFDEFNARFFNKELPPIELRTGYRGTGKKHRLGFFWNPGTECPTGFHPEKCIISLNSTFFLPEDEWRNTMLHEMVHYFVYMKFGKTSLSHGKEFKAEAKRINLRSEFEIDTYAKTQIFQPKPAITDRWGENFNDEIILGNYLQNYKTSLEDYVDEETNEVFKVERVDCTDSYAFRTKSRYIPEIIDNMRNIPGRLEWYKVEECSQRLFLLSTTTAVPSFKSDEIHPGIFTEYMEGVRCADDYGPIKWTALGITEFCGDGVQGYNPGRRKEDFRQKYFRDAPEIGRLAAERLVERYRVHPRWYTSTVHGTYSIKPACGEYTIQVDSRFKPLVAMTAKRILINPVHSEVMMAAVKSGDTGSLADEISRVILSRQ